MKHQFTKEEINFIYECLTYNEIQEEDISYAAYEVVEDYIRKLPTIIESTDPTLLNKLRHMIIQWLKSTLPILKKINDTYIHNIAQESFVHEATDGKYKKLKKLKEKKKQLDNMYSRINKEISHLELTPTPQLVSTISTVLSFVSGLIQVSFLPKSMKILYRFSISFLMTFIKHGVVKLFVYVYPMLKRFTDKLKSFLGIERKGLDPKEVSKFSKNLDIDLKKMKAIKERNK